MDLNLYLGAREKDSAASWENVFASVFITWIADIE